MTASQTSGEARLIAEQLRRAYDGTAWHGPSLMEVLSGVSEDRAAARPVTGAHSIWEIVLHVTAWLRVARERLLAAHPVDPSPEQDWPARSVSWLDALAELETQQRLLEQAIARFPDARLQETAPAMEPQTYYILLHGVVQHVCYHTGQIALLNK